VTSRRDFLKSGGALVISFCLDCSLFAQTTSARLPGSLNSNRMLNAWLRIDPEGTVTVFTGKIELGQGIGTAFSQIAADELDVDIGRIRMVHGDTALTPNEGQTAGSLSVENGGSAIRYACAEARALLLAAAATKLSVPANDLKVMDGNVSAPTGSSATYWTLTSELDLKKEATASVKPKPPSEYQYVGRSLPRRDIPKKFTGGAAYVQDIRLPGMLFGRVVRPPSPGAKLVSVNENVARRIPGVVAVVRDGDFLGVAAEREEQAIKARAALAKSAVWNESAALPPSGAALYEHMIALGVPAQVMLDKSAAAADAVKTLEARYTRPFQAHGSLGPSCAVAKWDSGRLHVWTHSQGVFPLRNDLATVFGLEPAAVRCTHAEGAGCYGHNGADDVALDAALVARAVASNHLSGRPVKLQWMREDEFMWEPYGSAMAMKLGGALDAQGNIVSWSHEVWSHPHSTRPGSSKGAHTLAARHLEKPVGADPVRDVPLPSGGADRNAVPGYDFPNVKVAKHFIVEAPLRTSALRTLGAYANVFAAESFMDELAAAAGADPVEFRLRHLKDPRARAVIEAAAARAGWKPGTRGESPGWGFAYSRYKNLGCYCAVAAQVAVERKSGQVRVLRAVSAVDVGQAVNPDGVVNQIEGGLIQSASWTLKEAVSFDRKRVRTRSWADYPILRFDEVPQVDVVILDQPNQPSLGVGEGAQGPAAAAIANAIANATGVRLRDLPFSPGRVKTLLT
jgi:CO/xanthine dehydrogenase Mo-binding subunit